MGKAFTSLEKAIDIISLFDSEHQDFSAHDISQKLKLPLSTTYKYLDVLLKRDFLSKDKDAKKFSLGLMFFKLGNLASAKIKPVDVARPHMQTLSKISGETVTLTVVKGWESLCVEKIETPKKIQLVVERGSSIPLHAGSSQTILLAYQDESFIEAMIEKRNLTKIGDNTLTEPDRLREELASIRKQGYAFSDSAVEPGAAAIAAPIFDNEGRIAAGLSVVGPRDRIRGEHFMELVDMVKEGAGKISYDLGWQPH